MSKRDYYAVLGIAKNASADEIKKAFRKLAVLHHPDKRGDSVEFVKIRHAYETILEDRKKNPVSNRETTRQSGKEGSHSEVYDPFSDSLYDTRRFYEPDNPKTEGFERSVRAKNCSLCHGIGKVTKNIHPEKGFLGLETRLCSCQWI